MSRGSRCDYISPKTVCPKCKHKKEKKECGKQIDGITYTLIVHKYLGPGQWQEPRGARVHLEEKHYKVMDRLTGGKLSAAFRKPKQKRNVVYA